jgi:rSAM/selenodomain-associated transferase 2
MGNKIINKKPVISIITPILNEAKSIDNYFKRLSVVFNENQLGTEVIIVDGGSTDDSPGKIKNELAKHDFNFKLLRLGKSIAPNRAKQLNLGARNAVGDILLFLHIDSILPKNALIKIKEAIDKGLNGGAFNISFQPKNFKIKIVELLDRFLIFTTKNFFGDQAIFTSKEFFNRVGGYREVELMEDLIMSDCLRKSKKFIIFKEPVITSSRRFYKKGIFKQLFLNIYLYNCFRFGASTEYILKKYEKF